MAYCAKCGAQMAEGATFCAACGAPAGGASTPGAAPKPLASNVAGLLTYIAGVITGVIFLAIEPYKNDPFVRFHAFQSIFYTAACIVVWIVWSIFTSLLFSVSGVLSFGFIAIIGWLISLAFFLGWLLLLFKAYNNERFGLPLIGDLAAKQAAGPIGR